jgi:GNAT superfamily N-acetyltransferase
MTPADLADVMAIAAQVHPAYPEEQAVFAERLLLSPEGCLCLADGTTPTGYIVSHRWRLGEPPELNTLLGAIPGDASSWYIHDLALLPVARGRGAAEQIVGRLADLARAMRCSSLSLVAVNQSLGFWERQGFQPVRDAALDRKLASYDAAACYMVRELSS